MRLSIGEEGESGTFCTGAASAPRGGGRVVDDPLNGAAVGEGEDDDGAQIRARLHAEEKGFSSLFNEAVDRRGREVTTFMLHAGNLEVEQYSTASRLR